MKASSQSVTLQSFHHTFLAASRSLALSSKGPSAATPLDHLLDPQQLNRDASIAPSLSLSLSLLWPQPSRSIAASVLSLFPPTTKTGRNLPSSGKSRKSEEGPQSNKTERSWSACAREGSRRGHGERSPGAPRTDGARSGAGPPSRGRAGSGGVGLPPSHPRPLPGHRWTKQRRAEQPQGLQVWTTLGFSSAASRTPLH